ncbi:MAG: translational GTPase TypA [Alphaproteobacteria bacterium]|nr:translational GTPase TypA [Alphaproteobacteria bacterium]
MNAIRNIAIIAHVDHGKTTLVDELLKQSQTFSEHKVIEDRVMDSNDLEKERGITIFSKCTSILYKDTRINIVDTPGHADFGGEVERILSMVDGVILLVDAAEGPLPQTKFVLTKSLALGIKPIVVINKVDRSDSRADEVLNEVFDLFVDLEADEHQLDFPILYACGRDGWAIEKMEDNPGKDLTPLLDLIIKYVPEPKIENDAPFSMLVTSIEPDPYVGRILTGKITSGSVKMNMPLRAIDLDGSVIENAKVTKILAFRGITRQTLDEAYCGDIVSIAGFSKATVSNTIADLSVETPIESKPIDPATLTMTFSVNTSPFAGKDGKKMTSRIIRERLEREVETNIALKLQMTDSPDSFEVSGRGELQLGILIETMRREGFELSISRPRVLLQADENGKKTEPYEEVIVDLDEEFAGTVIETLTSRKAEMTDMKPYGAGRQRITFYAPSRALLGYHSQFLTDTSGTGLINRMFVKYDAYKGEMPSRLNGVLVSSDRGTCTAYSLYRIQDRGGLFVGNGDDVYQGMIIGENSKDNDLYVNPVKAKQLSNVRSTGADEKLILAPAKKMALEECLTYIQDDELLEVTPKFLRLRKRFLTDAERKNALRSK